jgi:hypothetical protein
LSSELWSAPSDYQIDLALQSRYVGDSQGMIGFLGLFRFLAGLGAGVLQFFLAGRLMERFGIAAALLLLPASIALGSGAVLLTGGLLWAAAIPRACDIVLEVHRQRPGPESSLSPHGLWPEGSRQGRH